MRSSSRQGEEGPSYSSRWEAENALGPPVKPGVVRVNLCDGSWLLDGHIRGCVREEIQSGGGDAKVDELLQVMDRVLRR